jgi:hypothetical protein
VLTTYRIDGPLGAQRTWRIAGELKSQTLPADITTVNRRAFSMQLETRQSPSGTSAEAGTADRDSERRGISRVIRIEAEQIFVCVRGG